MTEQPETRTEWWRSSAAASIATAVIGLVGAAIGGYFTRVSNEHELGLASATKSRELALAELSHDQSVSMALFGQAVDDKLSLESRGRILRYMVHGEVVPPDMQQWAAAELGILDQALDAQSSSLAANLVQGEAALTRTDQEIAQAAQAPNSAERIEPLRQRRQELARSVDLLTVRRAEAAALSRLVAELPRDKGKSCKLSTVKAVDLGIEDPSQKIGDEYCRSSASADGFGTNDGRWVTRGGGRNFQCQCEVE